MKVECGGAWRSYVLRSHWRMVLPLSRAHQERTAARLRRLGVSAAILPVVEIVALPFDMPKAAFDAAIATSAKAFLKETAGPAAAPLFAVGARTARAARSATPRS